MAIATVYRGGYVFQSRFYSLFVIGSRRLEWFATLFKADHVVQSEHYLSSVQGNHLRYRGLRRLKTS